MDLKLLSVHFFFITEKVYNRQISAPILKRKSSRFGLGQFLSGSSNNNAANVASSSAHTHHHLQISSVPHFQAHHHSLHTQQSSSAGTTPTTPNLFTEKQYQYSQQQGQGYTNLGATGRS